ncbi:MAG: hypothetical protein NT133_01600 [Alphaproteobacteria bacterium]|nr:hypothetical protein [Alphaproteobacteria bacterium]
MAEVTDEDAERLANRLAMMVSEEGEAANAGRAVAQLARRLGLTGGQLKEMFLHGAMAGRRPASAGAEHERQEREIAVLRKSLRLMESNYRTLEIERDAMVTQLDSMRHQAAASRSSSQVRYIIFGVFALALAGAGTIGWLVTVAENARVAPGATAGTALPGPVTAAAPTTAQPDYGPVIRRVGVVRASRAVAYRQPDKSAPAIATLQLGMPIVVRRIFASAQVQWAEVEVGSALGYMLAAEIDLN